jgi:hypothetical protein
MKFPGLVTNDKILGVVQAFRCLTFLGRASGCVNILDSRISLNFRAERGIVDYLVLQLKTTF